jgi:hypothetical protein
MTDIATAPAIRNGVDTDKLFGTLDAVKAQPEIAHFVFRARNRWIDGARSRSTPASRRSSSATTQGPTPPSSCSTPLQRA